MKYQSDLVKSIDEALLSGYGVKDENGNKICGVKDLFDLIKNLVISASILIGCLGIIFSDNKLPGTGVLVCLATLALLPIFLLLIALIRLTFLVVERFPSYAYARSGFSRIIQLALTFILLCGLLAIGTAGLWKITS